MNSLKNRVRKFTAGGGKKANKLKLKKLKQTKTLQQEKKNRPKRKLPNT